MPTIKIRCVKSYESKGHDHRAVSIRIEIDLAFEPERFLARLSELDATAPDTTASQPVAERDKTLGGLFDAWRRSEEWGNLKPQTHVSYERVIDPTRGSLAEIRQRPLREFAPAFIVAVRDSVAKKRKRWMANYSVKVMRTAFAWGRLHGWCATNPAEGIPSLAAPADARPRNRAWSPEEFGVVWQRASPKLRRALTLAHYAGLRVSDIVAVPWSAWDGDVLTVRQSKTGQIVSIRAPRPLRDELSSAKREGTQILVNEQGRPYTRDGLQTNLWRLTKQLEAEKLVEPGLCFHGLRHSLGAALYDLGLDREARKAALGHLSDAASMAYERSGNRRAASDRAFAAFDQHLALIGKAQNSE